MSEFICETTNLTKKYKKAYVLNDINLKIKKGEIFGLIGDNGAGKTTILKIITGLYLQTEGNIKLFGKSDKVGLEKGRKKIGAMIETPALYLDMTARQNLEVQRLQRGIPGKEEINEVLKLVKLQDVAKKKVKNFSLGMKQRLGLAIALLGEPDILILDEPINGLDPTGIVDLRELLIKLNKEKRITIIISSHILSELYKVATNYAFIHEGKVIEQITLKDLDLKCKKHIHIRVKKLKEAVGLIEKSLGIKNYEVYSNNVIKIYEDLNRSTEINKQLALNNIFVEEITVKNSNLEAYFSNIKRGERNV